MTYFIIKLILSVVFGIALCLAFVSLAKRDSTQIVENYFKRYTHSVPSALLFLCGLLSISFALIIKLPTIVKDYSFDTSYRMKGIDDDIYGLYDESGKESEEYQEWEEYYRPLLKSPLEAHINYYNKKFIERFGERVFDEITDPSVRNFMYRDSTIRLRIKEVFGGDERYPEIEALSINDKYTLLKSSCLSEKEKKAQLIEQEKIERKRVYVDILVLLGFILLAVSFYVFFFNTSNVSNGKKVLKVIGYFILIVAYFNCSDYHSEFELKRAATAFAFEAVLICMSVLIIHYTKNKTIRE